MIKKQKFNTFKECPLCHEKGLKWDNSEYAYMCVVCGYVEKQMRLYIS